MSILFLADPNSIHDIKWISFFAREKAKACFLLSRVSHYRNFQNSTNRDSIIEKCGFRLLPPIHDFSIFRFYRTLYEALVIRRHIKENNIEVVHIMYAEPNSLWCLFRRFFSVPMIITTRGTDVLRTIPTFFKGVGLLNRTVAIAYKRAFRLADWVTVTSHAQAESIRQFSHREQSLMLIRTGVDVSRINLDTSVHFPLKDSKPFILFPRYLKPQYNHEFSLAAIALLPSEIKARHKMIFIGKDGGDAAYQKKLEELMMEQPDVQFELIEMQSQQAILELYKRAGVVVMVPSSDGSPVSGMEALLCGAKLILGPLNYDTDVFSQAIRMKTWNATELASLIVQAIEDRESPQLSRETIAAMDRERNMDKMMGIYRSLIESKEAS